MMIQWRLFISIACILCFIFGLSFTLEVVAQPDYPALRQSFDPELQRGLEHTLERLGLSRAVRRQRLSVAFG